MAVSGPLPKLALAASIQPSRWRTLASSRAPARPSPTLGDSTPGGRAIQSANTPERGVACGFDPDHDSTSTISIVAGREG
jgi:hypothetical protein